MRLRNVTPKSLFARMLAIILIPIILVQIISVFIFYERHWESVSRHMSSNLANDLGFLIGPILNAGGRLGKSDYATELMSTSSQKTIDDKTIKLVALNQFQRGA